MQTALYGIITEGREAGGECLIRANTQNISYISIVATHNTRQGKSVGRHAGA